MFAFFFDFTSAKTIKKPALNLCAGLRIFRKSYFIVVKSDEYPIGLFYLAGIDHPGDWSYQILLDFIGD